MSGVPRWEALGPSRVVQGLSVPAATPDDLRRSAQILTAGPPPQDSDLAGLGRRPGVLM